MDVHRDILLHVTNAIHLLVKRNECYGEKRKIKKSKFQGGKVREEAVGFCGEGGSWWEGNGSEEEETRMTNRAQVNTPYGLRLPGQPTPSVATYFRSILQMWVSLDLPEPQGSIRY